MSDDISVSVADLFILTNAIEVATKRGAFEANEMSSIGTSYDKVSRWLETVMQQEQEADSTGETNA